MRYIILIVIILAVFGLIWSAISFLGITSQPSTVNSQLPDFNQAVQDELTDKCQTPPNYTAEEWQDHMSHHPDRYQECFSQQELLEQMDYQNIGPRDLAQMLEKKNFTLIDVHVPEQAHIPGTDKFIPYDEITENLNLLPQDKSSLIVLYCRTGSMSRTAAEYLIKEGYTNVYNLVGGLNAWQNEGYEVENIKERQG